MTRRLFDRRWALWSRIPWLDRILLTLAAWASLVWLGGRSGMGSPGGVWGELALLAAAVLLFRWMRRNRTRLLWSLRNRLIAAYLLIAVVPIVLLLVMAGLSAYLLYSQFGAQLFYQAVDQRLKKLEATADALAVSLRSASAADARELVASPGIAALLEIARGELPDLQVRLNPAEDLIHRFGGAEARRFVGIVQEEDAVRLEAVVARPGPGGVLVVAVSAPLTTELLERLAPELGPISLAILRPAPSGDLREPPITLNGRQFVTLGQISTRARRVPAPQHWLDYEINGVTTLDAFTTNPATEDAPTVPLFVSFRTRPSQLNQRLFSSLGAFGGVAYGLLLVAGALFLLIELLALRSGIRLTRSVTRTVEQLYEATQHVRRGDFSHRVLPHERDQLGVLAESFNEMTGSIASLIEEQRQRQRLENELTIAREVQAELFPRTVPKIPGLQLSAICRAARMVSGDYYDFVPLTPNHLAIVLADISGKGISAALLMASLQAALRSQLLIEGAERCSTAELVARLNLHLFRNTSEDRYATLFFAIYDATSATLYYTNAGHLPPLYVCGNRVHRLETGGMVVGLFEHCTFEQGVLTLEPDSVLVAYSDGLVEPENVYGEEFGVQRVQAEVLRQQHLSPDTLAEALMAAVEEWSGAPTRADDMTIIVARRELDASRAKFRYTDPL